VLKKAVLKKAVLKESGAEEKCAPGRIRTCGTRYRKPVLYPLSYGGMHRSAAQTGD
jgi:hypothetical protein